MLWFGIDRKWWTLLVVGVGTFMSAVDGSVVNTALPVIQSQTGAVFSTLEWVVLIYLLTVISLLLVVGRLGDLYGRKRFYLAGFLIFTVGSALCGASPGIEALIIFRGVQAIGASMIFALAPAVLTGAFPGAQRGRALGMQATLTYLGLSAGPALGGLLTHHFGWRSIFFINIPIGMIVIPLGYLVLKRDLRNSDAAFDPAGAVALALALSSLLFALSKALDMGWAHAAIIGAFTVSAVAFAAFIIIETRVAHPMLDLKLFENRTFSASTAAAFLNYVANSSVTFLMPFYLIGSVRFRVDVAGLLLTATSIAMAMVAAPAGWLSDRIGVRIPATVGMCIVVIGMLMLRTLGPDATKFAIMAHLAFIGVGIGFFTSPNNSAIMGSAPESAQGIAGALLAAARNTGFAVGTAVAGLLYTHSIHANQHAPRTIAIADAMHFATTTVACIAAMGIIASAVRGNTKRPAKDRT